MLVLAAVASFLERGSGERASPLNRGGGRTLGEEHRAMIIDTGASWSRRHDSGPLSTRIARNRARRVGLTTIRERCFQRKCPSPGQHRKARLLSCTIGEHSIGDVRKARRTMVLLLGGTEGASRIWPRGDRLSVVKGSDVLDVPRDGGSRRRGTQSFIRRVAARCGADGRADFLASAVRASSLRHFIRLPLSSSFFLRQCTALSLGP